MAKIEAIKAVLLAHGGSASWTTIRQEIGLHYRGTKVYLDWQAGFRALIFREIKRNRTFEDLGADVFALK